MNIYLHRKAPGKAVIQLSQGNVCSSGATTFDTDQKTMAWFVWICYVQGFEKEISSFGRIFQKFVEHIH